MDSLRPENVSRRAMDRSMGEEDDLIIGRRISVGSPGTISGKRNKRERGGRGEDDCSSRSLIARSDHEFYHVQRPSRSLLRTSHESLLWVAQDHDYPVVARLFCPAS